MAREDDALSRRLAREARRALLRERNGDDSDGSGESGSEAVRAVREAAAAAAAAAAAGVVRGLAARRIVDEEEPEEPDDAGEQDEELDEPDDEPAAEATDDADTGEDEEDEEPPAPSPPRRTQKARRGVKPAQVGQSVRIAREQLALLNGVEPESVSSFEQTGDGCRVTLEVLELRRIPETTDVLASYVVELDRDGNLLSYERVRRYQRSEALDGDGA